MKLRSLSILLAFGSVSASWLACSSRTCVDDGTCGIVPAGDAGVDAPSIIVPAGCELAKEAKDSPACVDDAVGIFVDGANGSDANAGTKASPAKTIGAALGKLAGKPRVYICEGTYGEHVRVAATASLIGGFECGGWRYTGAKPRVTPEDKGTALDVRAAGAEIEISDMVLEARDATEASESSIAVFVANTSKVSFRRVGITAGVGQKGADATSAAAFSPASAPSGTSGAGPGAGAETKNEACMTSIGGAGGKDGATSGGSGVIAIAPVYPDGNTGAGGTAGPTCNAGGGGSDGAYGVAGAAGVGAATAGVVDPPGWKPADGVSGGAGGNGQGGGGGAQRVAGGTGGAGGHGG